MTLTASEISQIADRLFAAAPAPYHLMQRLRPYICPFELLAPQVPAGARLLDVGCGGGLFLGVLAQTRRIASGHGIDASPRAISVAKTMALQSGLNRTLRFECADSLDAILEASFDAVSLIDVLHHIPPISQRDFFVRVARRVRPGGVLVFKDMTETPRLLALANRLHDLVLVRELVHYVEEDKIRTWVSDLALDLTHREQVRRLWYSHRLMIFERRHRT